MLNAAKHGLVNTVAKGKYDVYKIFIIFTKIVLYFWRMLVYSCGVNKKVFLQACSKKQTCK